MVNPDWIIHGQVPSIAKYIEEVNSVSKISEYAAEACLIADLATLLT